MKFVVDAQLPPALVRALQEQGVDAVHVAALGLIAASDDDIAKAAAAAGAVIVTKDRDFVGIAMVSRLRVLWLRLGNIGNAQLITAVVSQMPAVLSAFAAGETIVEIQ